MYKYIFILLSNVIAYDIYAHSYGHSFYNENNNDRILLHDSKSNSIKKNRINFYPYIKKEPNQLDAITGSKSKKDMTKSYLISQNHITKDIDIKKIKTNTNEYSILIEEYVLISNEQDIICDSSVRAYWLKEKSIPSINASIPNNLQYIQSESKDYPYLENSIDMAKNILNSKFNYPNIYIKKNPYIKKCLLIKNKKTHKVWPLIAYIDNRAYQLYAGDENIFDMKTMDLRLSGYGDVYKNSTNDKITNLEIGNIEDGGYLINKSVHVLNNRNYLSQNTRGVLQNDKYIFNFDIGTEEFEDTNIFYYANKTYDFVKKYLKGDMWDIGPIKISVSEGHNPYFTMSGVCPTYDLQTKGICMQTGNDSYFKNLVMSDVVRHEIMHYFISNRLDIDSSDLSYGGNLEMHEGLADLIVVISNQDPCIGKTICHEDAEFCFVQNGQIKEGYGDYDMSEYSESCLRTAINNLKFDTEAYHDLPYHQRGQLISRLGWEMYDKIFKNNIEELYKIIFLSIELLAKDADIKGYVNYLLSAEQQVTNKYKCEILEIINDLNIPNKINCYDEDTLHNTTEQPKNDTTEDEKSFPGCSITIENKNKPGNTFFILILFLMPFLIFIKRRMQI